MINIYLVLRVYVELWRVVINNIKRIVEYEVVMSTSNFEYGKRLYDIKMSMNAFKY